MQRFESRVRFGKMQLVGQAVMQRVQVPQWSVENFSSGSSSMPSKISARKKVEPACGLISMEFFPIQPKPARCASSL